LNQLQTVYAVFRNTWWLNFTETSWLWISGDIDLLSLISLLIAYLAKWRHSTVKRRTWC